MRRRVHIGRRKAVDEPEIIVIPMIDVMMFLLFFFMVASLAMVVQAGLPVTLPKASTSQSQNAESVTITLQANGGVFLNTRRTTIDALEQGLAALHVSPKQLVTINCDVHVPYGNVVAVMDEARKAGVVAFGFATAKR